MQEQHFYRHLIAALTTQFKVWAGTEELVLIIIDIFTTVIFLIYNILISIIYAMF